MTDTTNTEPPLPAHPYGQAVSRSIKRYGDARAAHAVAQIKAREITDAEIDALLFDAIGFELETEQWMNRSDLHRIVRAAIALANGRG